MIRHQGTESRTTYPYYEVLGHKFAESEYELALRFAQQRATVHGKGILVFCKPDSLSTIFVLCKVEPR